MNATEFISVLEARGLHPTPAGEGWSSRCPGHEDRGPSLSVSRGTDGRVLLKCFAGCSAEAVVGSLELKLSDLFPTKASNGGNPPQKISAVYPYHDELGNLIYQAVRLEPKSFRQRRPDPDKPGEWIWNMSGVRRVLFRLPEVLAAVAAGRPIWVVEGEKDALALVAKDLDSTCNSGGASKWLPAYSEALRGADVSIVADKDVPGRAHAQQVAKSLAGCVKSVRILEVPDTKPDAPERKQEDSRRAEPRQNGATPNSRNENQRGQTPQDSENQPEVVPSASEALVAEATPESPIDAPEVDTFSVDSSQTETHPAEAPRDTPLRETGSDATA